MQLHRRWFGLLAASALVPGWLWAQSGQHPATPFEEAEIRINNRADADGYVRFRVQPVGGAPIETTVDVLSRMGENDIAGDIEKALTVALGSSYEVNRSGGESVRIRKADRDNANFTVEIAFNTPGLSILLGN
jgi:hypothetical protein